MNKKADAKELDDLEEKRYSFRALYMKMFDSIDHPAAPKNNKTVFLFISIGDKSIIFKIDNVYSTAFPFEMFLKCSYVSVMSYFDDTGLDKLGEIEIIEEGLYGTYSGNAGAFSIQVNSISGKNGLQLVSY